MSRGLRWLSATLLACAAATLLAQGSGLPPIFADTPLALRPSRTVAELPRNTFLENLLFDAAGVGYVNSHLDGTVYRLGSDGRLQKFAQLPGKIAGIALDSRGALVVSGADTDGQAVLFGVDAQGGVRVAAQVPGAVFLNGLVRLDAEVYLVADSYKGALWRVDLATGTAALWLQHPLLARNDPQNPTPGVNGIKLDRRRVLVSNTARQTLLAIPLQGNGSAGAPQVLHERVNVDDFIVDADGSILAATHVYNSVIRIAPDGRVSVLAGAAQGLAGSTAVAMGRAPGKTRLLYVTTNGGMFLPPATGVETAKVVELALWP